MQDVSTRSVRGIFISSYFCAELEFARYWTIHKQIMISLLGQVDHIFIETVRYLKLRINSSVCAKSMVSMHLQYVFMVRWKKDEVLSLVP
jgi:hypothetical protein